MIEILEKALELYEKARKEKKKVVKKKQENISLKVALEAVLARSI
ncbi:3213_t:CDS:1, partial [Gigaspora margarita]